MRTLKHFLPAILLLCSVPSIAQWIPTANLTVFSDNGAKFFIVLNGERYNDEAQTNIRIEELPNPYYNCKIIFEDKSLPEISKNALMLADADGEMQDVTYRIKKDNKGKNVLRFFSFAPAQQNMVRPANCATYRFGAPNMLLGGSTTIIQKTNINPATNVSVNVGGIGMNVMIDAPIIGGNTTTTTTTTRTTNYAEEGFSDNNYQQNNNSNNRRNTDANRRGGCNTGMSIANFNEAKATIANNGFDETKLSTAKQIIAANCMTTTQISSILSSFGFEESKLDFAKYAYEYCIDRNNYFKVVNAFTFESSKTELNNYVESMR